MKRAALIVLDGVGVGALEDAHLYGDQGANTLCNVALRVGGIDLPNLESLGLGHIAPVCGLSTPEPPLGSFGILREASPGKDTITGHWELMGVTLDKPFRTYPNGFPAEVISEFESRIGRRTLGNVAASGTEIIKQLGQEHIATAFPIVYTSADSVFQVACHEDVVGVDVLYGFCQVARDMLYGEHLVARVIARPFEGVFPAFRRTPRRKDFSVLPPYDTVLNLAEKAGKSSLGIGKIEDIYGKSGVTDSVHTDNNAQGIEAIIGALRHRKDWHILMANLVDFDMLWGHRNDIEGFALGLKEFDRRLPEVLEALSPDDILIITADHGCDPTMPGTDHTREQVPVLVYGKNLQSGVNLGVRQSLADVGASISEHLEIEAPGSGKSFMSLLRR